MENRKRVGMMMPSADGTAEPDFQMVLGPKGVAVHGHRLWQDDNRHDPEKHFGQMNSEIESAARYLSSVRLDAIAYTCTTGSFFKGPGWDQEMLQKIKGASGVEAFATTPSVVKALQFKGARKISAITPYPEWNNIKLREYMEAMGFEVLNVDAHPKPSLGEIMAYEQDPDEIVEWGIEKCDPDADVLFCSCTDWRSMEAAERLEKETGKPVVTSNQATIWLILQHLGIRRADQGLRQSAGDSRPSLTTGKDARKVFLYLTQAA